MADELDLDKLEALEKAATPGEWIWYNGCSWWRLGLLDQRKHAAVICPTIDTDGHPNLNVCSENMAVIVASRNTFPELLRRARRLDRIERAATDCVNFGWGTHHRKLLRAALEER